MSIIYLFFLSATISHKSPFFPPYLFFFFSLFISYAIYSLPLYPSISFFYALIFYIIQFSSSLLVISLFFRLILSLFFFPLFLPLSFLHYHFSSTFSPLPSFAIVFILPLSVFSLACLPHSFIPFLSLFIFALSFSFSPFSITRSPHPPFPPLLVLFPLPSLPPTLSSAGPTVYIWQSPKDIE